MMKDWLYKLDADGRMRVWRMELGGILNGASYRTISGLEDGQHVTTGWVTAKANTLRDAHEQARFEVDAAYKYKLKTDYYATREEALKGPRHVEPMLAKGYDKAGNRVSDMSLYSAQPKLDGIRAIAKADGMFSRSGERFLTTGVIEEALRPLFASNPDLVLDGELYNHAYHDKFNELSGLIRKGMNAKTPPTAQDLALVHPFIQYHVYDMPSHPGEQRERHVELAEMDWDSPYLHYVETWALSGRQMADQLYERWVGEGYEGAMYRLLSAPYEYGKRPWSLLKRKEFETREFKIKRVEEGEGDWKGRVKRIVYEWDDGREFASGLRMSQAGAAAWWGHHLAGVELYDSCTVRYMPPPEGALPRVAVAIDFHGPEGRRD